MKIKVVIAGRWSRRAIQELKLYTPFEVIESPTTMPSDEMLSDCQALLIRSKTQVKEELLHRAPRLQVIATATSGFDHIDLEATQLRGIEVYFAPDGNARSAAELTWALVLACARQIPRAQMQNSLKATPDRTELEGLELAQKTYGIVGLGRIGTRVARMAAAFDMRVIAHDPYAPDRNFELVGAERVGLEELIKLSDVVSVHVPLTKETHQMFNALTFEAMGEDAIFVNTSRGQVVNEADLAAALERGDLKMAGLDVLEKEPLAQDSPLFKLKNVVLTPHIGAFTEEAFERSSRIATQYVIDFFVSFFNETPAKGNLPPQEPWYSSPRGRKS